MEITLENKTVDLLLDYLGNFYKWNQAYNLSAVREPEKMVYRHLLDSLTLVPFLKKSIDDLRSIKDTQSFIYLVDVGTGGGLPGLPLAIVFPEINVSLLDSNGKKTRFLFQTVIKLGLKNVTIENKRLEEFLPTHKFDIVTSRAFASLSDMVKGSAHLLGKSGEYWAMKGVYPESELNDCADRVKLIEAAKLNVPDILGNKNEEERYLIRLQPF